jgi:hypothetical protein
VPHFPEVDARPQRHGWAPGNYITMCHDCGKQFQGDKRAIHCAPCAYGADDDPFSPEAHSRLVSGRLQSPKTIGKGTSWASVNDVVIPAETVPYRGEHSAECEADVDSIMLTRMHDRTLMLVQADDPGMPFSYINVGPLQARAMAEQILRFSDLEGSASDVQKLTELDEGRAS